ncbi:MAG: flagellin lysine-N-methylase, partial [Oscillospiraceae bacterium]|nr:flagellin lysine-N-methylase [Oscillospiraceae bacterium]
MIEVYPEYYKDFKCIASECRHSCCIGWEIDIDEESAERFKSVSGELGDKLRRSISGGDEPHFILSENERCPFLNENNLCEIILELGEDAICQICADHPRFRTYLSERTEIGLGLCCEEAGRLIIGRSEPFSLIEEGEGFYTADEDALMDLREEIFEIMAEERPICRRMDKVLSLCGGEDIGFDVREWASFLLRLERLDEGWTLCLERIAYSVYDETDIPHFMDSHSLEFTNLFNYFIYRHFFSALDDGDIVSKVGFAVLSCRIIAALCLSHGGA